MVRPQQRKIPRKAILNTARMGKFSGRAMDEDCAKARGVRPVTVVANHLEEDRASAGSARARHPTPLTTLRT